MINSSDLKISEDLILDNLSDGVRANSGASNSSSVDRKLFVGGLDWTTSEQQLYQHFIQFGQILWVNIKVNSFTGHSRGFAFIVFANKDAIEKVLAAGVHVINHKRVDTKRAKGRYGKLFVGGLTSKISDDDITSYFSQFGKIISADMPFNKETNKRKGFCFITFESEQVVNDLLKTPKQIICGQQIDVKCPMSKTSWGLHAAVGTSRWLHAARRNVPLQWHGCGRPDYYHGFHRHQF